MIAAEGHEVSLPRRLESFQSPRHKASLRRRTSPLKPKYGLNGPPAFTKNVKVGQPRFVNHVVGLDTKYGLNGPPAHAGKFRNALVGSPDNFFTASCPRISPNFHLTDSFLAVFPCSWVTASTEISCPPKASRSPEADIRTRTGGCPPSAPPRRRFMGNPPRPYS